MEKLIVKAVVILGLTFSYHAMAGTYWACAGGPCNTGTFNSGSGNASSGNLGAFMPGYVQGSGMGGGPSAADMAKRKAAEEAGKKEGQRQCKLASLTRTENCNKSATNLHRIDSMSCSVAKWVGGALGVAGGWAAVEGEGAATVILGGAGMAVYQMGDDCQTDMDRVLDASKAICNTDQAKRDLDCDAIK